MESQAERAIRQGLSAGARGVLALVAVLAAVIVWGTHPETGPVWLFHLVAGWCLLLALACMGPRRFRPFFGSCLGVSLFLWGLAYLVAPWLPGSAASGESTVKTLLGAALYLWYIGWPGLRYALQMRFGRQGRR